MTEILIQPNDLGDTAKQFSEASTGIQTIMKNLDDSTEKLEKQWRGATQQTFYKQYKDLHNYLDAFSAMAANIAREMNALADRFEKLDR